MLPHAAEHDHGNHMMDFDQTKLSGETNPVSRDMPPATPRRWRPWRRRAGFKRVVSMPIARAAISSSRIAPRRARFASSGAARDEDPPRAAHHQQVVYI